MPIYPGKMFFYCFKNDNEFTNDPAFTVDTRTMVKLIKQCQTVRAPTEVNRRGSASRAMRADNPKTNSSVSWTTFVTTIVPGMTKEIEKVFLPESF